MVVGVIGFPVADVREDELARRVEDLGYESLFHPEHTHIPASRESDFPATPDGSLPGVYTRNLDPFVALAAAAAVTSEIRLGTAICLIAQRDPIVTAKVTASLDQISGGRLVLGVGAGWNVEEMRNHGVDPAARWRRAREHVMAIRSLWTEEEASFHGDFVEFDAVWSWPKPVQRPHPPILAGGAGPRAIARVLGWADGWLPALDDDLASTLRQVQALHEQCREQQRQCPPITLAYGPLRELRAGELEQLAGAGIARVLLAYPELPQRDTFALITRMARQCRDELGELGRDAAVAGAARPPRPGPSAAPRPSR